MEYVLRTEGLSKSFGLTKALTDVDMQIRRGEIYGFIGKNGAGKTTLMRIVLGAAMPSSGSVELFGGEDPAKARRRIGALLESPSLYKDCTAFENLKRFSILSGNTNEEIRGILELVGLGNTGKKKVGKFSLGMKQRLGIAVALLGHPEFLVLDEPINGLDPSGIKEVRDLLLKLNREKGVTILVSSHLLDELAKIVTTYGVIRKGQLIEQVSADELLESCRKQLSITVDDPDKAYELLRCITTEDKLSREGNTIRMYEHVDKAPNINRMLVRHGVYVSELRTQSGSLEEYFIERLG